MSKVSTKYSIEQEENLFSSIPEFFELENRNVEVSFTAPDLSSFGGLMAVAKAEKTLGIVRAFSRCVKDWRDQRFITHTIEGQVRQRVFQIAAGYEDGDDCDALRNDSILKMCCGRQPDGTDLCSQPTMSRLENHVQHTELYQMGEVFIDSFIKSYGDDVPAKIILDLDDSNSNTYGAQQLSLFNEYYGEYCYMPLFIFEGYSGRMILPVLRPGRVSKRLNVYGIIRRLVKRIRQKWPHVIITVRGDAMFASHEMFEWSDTVPGIHFCVGLTGNKKLNDNPIVINLMARAKSEFNRTKEPQRHFAQFLYKAGSWKKDRWVIVKVERNSLGSNIRYIVTDRTSHNPADSRRIYEKEYCRRGMCELWIKELKNDLRIDRMSCSSFSANQFRVYLHALAYVLLWHVRHELLHGTAAEDWTIATLQLRLIKSAVRVTTLKTKIKIEFGRDHPEKKLIQKALSRA